MEFSQSVAFMDECSCTGCALCAEICPKECITFTPNDRGFLLPSIGKSCINCGLCVKTCPSLQRPDATRLNESYAARSTDQDNLLTSTAGGMSKPLISAVVKRGGIAYGAGYSDDWSVEHVACTSINEAHICSGSKYVQSDLLSNRVYEGVEEGLRSRPLVLFIGLPCQVAAMRARFGKREGLYLIDLVCHGVASPMLWEKYLNRFEKSSIRSIRFRNKTYGYHMSTMEILSVKGIYRKSGRIDPYLKAFFSGIAHRKCCNECRFKGVERFSDITLFDCSRFTELTGQKDDDRGYSSIMVNSEKGRELLEMLKDEQVQLIPVDRSRCEMLNGKMISGCTPRHPLTDDFYYEVRRGSVDSAVKKYLPSSNYDGLIETAKGIAFHFGLMGALRRVKDRKALNGKR